MEDFKMLTRSLSVGSCVTAQIDCTPMKLALPQRPEVPKANHFYVVGTELISWEAGCNAMQSEGSPVNFGPTNNWSSGCEKPL